MAAQLRDATVQCQLTAGSRQIPALFGCCLCLCCCCCLCFFSRRSPSLVIIALRTPLPRLLPCLFVFTGVASSGFNAIDLCARLSHAQRGVRRLLEVPCNVPHPWLPAADSPALSRPLRPLFLCASDQIPPRLVLDLCAVATDDAQLFLVATRNVSVQRATYYVPACL